ncbi:MAG: deoxyribose-phosphate aldolase [Candidatus Eisenbacteria sp.]|nr:deoxyribose-phosphate aldolase [Candidatus Eisenbacteria bacterium]
MTDVRTVNRIAIGADHGGFQLKEQLRAYLNSQGYVLEDCGTFSEEAVDYPRIAAAVARLVASGDCERGVIIDGAGIGSAMVANKVPGVRAALCYDVSSASNAREHNDANVLTLGARLIGLGLAEQLVDVFLTTECKEERHLKRVAMIGEVESGQAVEPPPPPAPGAAPSGQVSANDLERIAREVSSMLSTGAGLSSEAKETICGELICGLCADCIQRNPEAVRTLINTTGADRISLGPGGEGVPKDLAKYIDHTHLKPDATGEEIRKLCREASEYGFATVCVNPNWVPLCRDELAGSDVRVCTVVGFPLGAHQPEIKAMEARRAIREGAREIDMVINIGALKGEDYALVERDIRAVADACHESRAILKVIIETALLTDEEKAVACQLARKARADYVKTSTGFASAGATVGDVALMSEAVKGAKMGVKAAGGIGSAADAEKMIQAGATRIGASAGIRIVDEARRVTLSN